MEFNIKNYSLLIIIFFLYKVRNIDLKYYMKYILFRIYILTKKGKLELLYKKEQSKKIIKNMLVTKKYLYNFTNLPEHNISSEDIMDIIYNRKSDVNSYISGCIYINDKECIRLLENINKQYLFSNPLHPDIYPELIKMESEIIKMVGQLYELPDKGGGNLTTGGTESTILALKAYKKIKNKSLWFSKPEVLCTKTVHAAVYKACELLDLNIVFVDLDKDFVMDVNDLSRKITNKSCVIVASAPCFAYGLMDPILKISKIAKKYNIPLHVDACLGGFICQFNEELKLSFNMNIQSVSIDPHKYGYSPKGSSILLWKDNELKHNQYFIVEDWTGGIYASVSLPGSRVGSQIATTWATLLYNGYDCYNNYSNKIISKILFLKNEIKKINTFEIIGNPNVNVVAFYSKKYSIGQIVDHLKKYHWNINILQNPLCLHICVTPKNISECDNIPNILKEILNQKIIKEDSGLTAIYGMGAKIPDKSIIKDLVKYYLDLTTNI